MRPTSLPLLVRAQFGNEATEQLERWVYAVESDLRDEVLATVTNRFEMRLADEAAKLRVEMAGLRADIAGQLASMRTELLRWSFLFWIGQAATTAAFLAVLARLLRP